MEQQKSLQRIGLGNLALYDKKSIELHNAEGKIRNFTTADQFNTLQKILVRYCSKAGIETPAQEILIDIMKFLKDQFMDFTPQEILNALDLNDATKLPRKINNYNKLTTTFLGDVLPLYRKYRNTQIILSDQQLRNQKLLNEPTSFSDKEFYDIFIQYVIKHKKFPLTADYISIFKYMESIKEIKMSNKEKFSWKKECIKAIKDEALSLVSGRQKDYVSEGMKFIKLECRKRMVQKVIKEKYL